MPVQLTNQAASRNTRKIIGSSSEGIVQKVFPKSYVSTVNASRRPLDSFSDMTNMELIQDNTARPRPPLNRYGTQPPYPVVGRGKYRYNGVRGLLWMLNVGGVGKVYRQVDGGAFTLVGGTYDITNWNMFCQTKGGRAYVWNKVNKLSYVDLNAWSIVTYASLATPGAATVTGSANLISGSKPYNYYYRISANNDQGESIASTAATVNVNVDRDKWNAEATIAKTVAVSWSAVTGATSYTIYVGDKATITNELTTVTATSFTDDGKIATNPYKLAPEGNSTDGFVATWLYNDPKNAQVFGTDPNNKLYYSAPGTGDFSPYNGGGWVTIDEDGDTQLNFVDGFHNGKGDPVLTTSSRGAAGKGLLCHVTFNDLTIGSQVITYPSVYQAGGQAGTYAPRATIKANDSLTYFTGQDVVKTRTSPSIVNVLSTATIGQGIIPDIQKLNLQALDGACGVEDNGRLYFCLPVGSTTNNQIWYNDPARGDAWVMPWPVSARDIWQIEDTGGTSHLCVLVGNIVLEFNRNSGQAHQDDGVAWKSRLAFDALTWDPAGICLGNVDNQYHKLLQPNGTVSVNATGLSRAGSQTTSGGDTFTTGTTYTGIGQWDYSGDYQYGDDPGTITSFSKSVAILRLRPKGLLNQLAWEVIGQNMGTDYIYGGCATQGWYDEKLILKV